MSRLDWSPEYLNEPFGGLERHEGNGADEAEGQEEERVAQDGEGDGVAKLVHQGAEDDVAEHVAAPEDLERTSNNLTLWELKGLGREGSPLF